MSTSTFEKHSKKPKTNDRAHAHPTDDQDHGVFNNLDHEHFERNWLPEGMQETDVLPVGSVLKFGPIPQVNDADAQAVLLYIDNPDLEQGDLGDDEYPFVLGIAEVVEGKARVRTTVPTLLSTIHPISLPSVQTWIDWLQNNGGYPQWLGPTEGVDSIARLQQLLEKGPLHVIPFGKVGHGNDHAG